MGRGGFEPPKVRTTRFTVWPIWPLWNLPLQAAPPRELGSAAVAPIGHRRPASARTAARRTTPRWEIRRRGRATAARWLAKAQVFQVPGASADASVPRAPCAPTHRASGRGHGTTAAGSVRSRVIRDVSRFHGTARPRSGDPAARALRVPGGSGRDRVVFRCPRRARARSSARWSRRWESNPQPPDYKSGALPIEPRRRLSTRGEARGRA